MVQETHKEGHGDGGRDEHHHKPEHHHQPDHQPDHHLDHHRHHEHEHPELHLTIAVNGEAEIWHHHRITYEEVVKLAFPDCPTGGEIRYSVSWTKPDGQEGSLRPDHSVDVVERMMFDVRNTDKS